MILVVGIDLRRPFPIVEAQNEEQLFDILSDPSVKRDCQVFDFVSCFVRDENECWSISEKLSLRARRKLGLMKPDSQPLFKMGDNVEVDNGEVCFHGDGFEVTIRSKNKKGDES